jgi:predicted nucleic acid-binding Zn ribbon protein
MTDFITASSKQDYTRNDCSSIGSKEVQQTRYCITCGNDITNQKKGSVFCSEKVFGKDAKKCRNQKSNPENNYKRKELKLYPGVLLLFDISTLKINQARSC